MAKHHHHFDYSADYSNQINRALDDFDEYDNHRRKASKPRQLAKRKHARRSASRHWDDQDDRTQFDSRVNEWDEERYD